MARLVRLGFGMVMISAAEVVGHGAAVLLEPVRDGPHPIGAFAPDAERSAPDAIVVVLGNRRSAAVLMRHLQAATDLLPPEEDA